MKKLFSPNDRRMVLYVEFGKRAKKKHKKQILNFKQKYKRLAMVTKTAASRFTFY